MVPCLGAALLLLHHTPDTVLAQGYGCVDASLSQAVGYCDSCCLTQSVYYNESFEINGSGFYDLNDSAASCGNGTTGSCLNQSPPQYCSTSFDSWNLSGPDEFCCPGDGDSCDAGQCCYPMVCVGGTCQSCTECSTDDDCINETGGYLTHCDTGSGCCTG